MLNFASVAYKLRRPFVAALCVVAVLQAHPVSAVEVMRVATGEVMRVAAGERVMLDFGRAHGAKLAVVTSGGEWLFLVDKQLAQPLMSEAAFLAVSRVRIDTGSLKGTRFENGTEVQAAVFTAPGRYTFVASDNLETEPETMSSRSIAVDYLAGKSPDSVDPMFEQVKAFYSWVLVNADAAASLAPRIRDVPLSNRFGLDTSQIEGFKQHFASTGLFAPEFGDAVDRYYGKYKQQFEAMTPREFDEVAANVRGPMMEVENMDIFFCAQEYEYTREFIDGMRALDHGIQGDTAVLVVESPYKWKTKFNFQRVADRWLISGYCVYE